MTKRPPTLTDYAVIAISPALIMLMLGSLVFFLIEVLYQGKYSDRLLWTMFFFVFGSVLISRILIQYGASRAMIYAAGLSVATLLALQGFVEYPNLTMRSYTLFINAALMALIWWAANKLTWDCTHIDEDRRSSGQGVLAAAGLDTTTPAVDDDVAAPVKKLPKDPEGLAGWFERWQRHRSAKLKQPHTPGVWVLYFALGALPLFGLGQSLIPVEATDRRRVAFQQMAVYVASALGLLVTTTLLGVRKYLRDRGASMPHRMTAGWLGVGAVLILAFLGVGAILPRPHSETPLVKLPKWADSPERKASKNAVKKDGSTGDGDGAKGKTDNDGNAKQSSDSGKGKAPGESKDGEPQSGEGDKNGGDAASDKKDGERTAGEDKTKTESKRKADAKPGEPQGEDKKDDSQNKSEEPGESPTSKPSSVSKVMDTAGSVLKWLVWIVAALVIIAATIFFLLRGLAPFTKWAQGILDWFRALFARNAGGASIGNDADVLNDQSVERPPPFATFSNPFQDGTHRQQSSEALVLYTFEAFDAWAWDHGCGREGKETPVEFATRVMRENPKLEAAKDLARLVTQAQYAECGVSDKDKAVMKKFWSELRN